MSAMQLDQLAGHGEAQPGAAVHAGHGAIALFEGLEDGLLAVGRDADAGIRHLDLDARAARTRANGHATAFGELDGVADQVVQDLLQPVLVRIHRRQVVRHGVAQRQAAPADQRGSQCQHHVDHHTKIHRSDVQAQLVAADLRQIEDVVDQGRQARSAGDDEPELVTRLVAKWAAAAVEQRFGQAEYAHERRAQFMRGVGEELVLQRVESLQRTVDPHLLGQLPSVPVARGKQENQQEYDGAGSQTQVARPGGAFDVTRLLLGTELETLDLAFALLDLDRATGAAELAQSLLVEQGSFDRRARALGLQRSRWRTGGLVQARQQGPRIAQFVLQADLLEAGLRTLGQVQCLGGMARLESRLRQIQVGVGDDRGIFAVFADAACPLQRGDGTFGVLARDLDAPRRQQRIGGAATAAQLLEQGECLCSMGVCVIQPAELQLHRADLVQTERHVALLPGPLVKTQRFAVVGEGLIEVAEMLVDLRDVVQRVRKLFVLAAATLDVERLGMGGQRRRIVAEIAQGDAQIVQRLRHRVRVIALAAELERLVVRLDGFVQFAEAAQGDTDVVVGLADR